MSEILYPEPRIDLGALQTRKTLEAELFSLDSQIGNFTRLRDRLSAAGKDANAVYRDIQVRRGRIAATLRKSGSGIVTSKGDATRIMHAPHDESLLKIPLSPAHYNPLTGIYGFGTSGFVQMAPAREGINETIGGKYPATGGIETVAGAYPGEIIFDGVLEVGPDEVPVDQIDPTINYFWIHNWTYLIPFPPPTVSSRLTYRFDVYASDNIAFQGVTGQAMTFVALGETPDLTTGTTLQPNIDAGWPLSADLTRPAPQYNGHYGTLSGQVSVQRSLDVSANQVPGVALVVGAIGTLAMQSRVNFEFAEYSSYITVSTQTMTGRVAYLYEPLRVFSGT